jgi:hypothetical protein
MIKIVPIVEGYGEIEAFPVLLRRILNIYSLYHVAVDTPWRVGRDEFISPRLNKIEDTIESIYLTRNSCTHIFVLLDRDDPITINSYKSFIKRSLNPRGIFVKWFFAVREYETWFLSVKESIRGRCGIRNDAVTPPNYENIRDAKRRLTENMEGNVYKETLHQVVLSARFDLNTASTRCRSLSRLIRVMRDL